MAARPSSQARGGLPARGGFPARIAGAVQRGILGAFMSLAVVMLERRIRKALRGDSGQAAGSHHDGHTTESIPK